MIRRAATWSRRLAGGALLGAGAWWALQAVLAWWRSIPLVAVDADTGARYGFRVSALTPAERVDAERRERLEHGFDIATAGDLSSGPPAPVGALQAPTAGVATAGGDMPGPHPTPRDWPLRAPVDHLTFVPQTTPELAWERADWSPPGPSGAVQSQGRLTLSEARPRPADLAAAAAALERIAGDLLTTAERALEAGADLGEPTLTRAGGRLAVASAGLRDVLEQLRDRAQVLARLEQLAPAPPIRDDADGERPDERIVLVADQERPLIWIAAETALERRARDGDR